jgi:hypothetical protein
MTSNQFAVLLLRFLSVYLFVDAFIFLTEVPTHIYGVYRSEFDFIIAQRKLALGLAVFRVLVCTGAGIGCLVFNRALAKLFTIGLEGMKNHPVP